jgi:hypothetical protein
MSRVEPAGDLLDAQDVDVGRQRVVDSTMERIGWEGEVNIKVRDLSERVDPRVSTAGSIQLELIDACRLPDCPLDFSLNRLGVLLDLPSAVTSTGIFNKQFESHDVSHGSA